MAQLYNRGLQNIENLELPSSLPGVINVYWMYAPRVTKKLYITRDELCNRLRMSGIDTRDYFIPLHRQPILRNLGFFKKEKCPISDDLSRRGFYIPSGLAITERQIRSVVAAIKKILS